MESTPLIFAGPYKPSCMTSIYFLILVLISIALLICMENTFWNINDGDGNFVKVFKKSFKLYVKSGKREMTERDFEILKNEHSENLNRDNNVTHGTTARFSMNFEFSRRIFYGEESLEA